MSNKIYKTLNQYLSRERSRRDFIQTVSALGLTPLAANSLLAYVQEDSSEGIRGNPVPGETIEITDAYIEKYQKCSYSDNIRQIT